MGNWGQEERHCPTFPFLPGQGFEIVILADSHHYKIAINGHHFTEFHCRAPMERVSYLSADGEIMITTITFEGGSHHGHMPGPGHMPAPMPHNPSYGGGVAPYPPQVPHNPGYGGPAPYPAGMNPYPTQPGMPYPAAPGMAGYPAAGYTTGYGHLSPKSAKKAAKKQAKAQKKAMKYGLGAAGLGVGAYALHKGMKHGHHGYHGHGSSSSSSSSEEE